MGRDRTGGDLGEVWHAQRYCAGAVADQSVDLGELGVGGGEADFEPLGLASPTLLDRLGDAGGEAVADLEQAWPLAWVGSQERTAGTALSELTVSSPFVRFLICESGGMRDSADDEARVATVDARQGVAEVDRGSAGDAGGQKERPSFSSAGRELADVQGGDGGASRETPSLVLVPVVMKRLVKSSRSR
jgi:hypothetical protein